MKLLLDTHALVWWWIDHPRLTQAASTAIADPDNTIYVSAASAWELATKHRLSKWPDVETIVRDFPTLLRRSRFVPLPVTAEHALAAGTLASPHRDPFDRMLIAQCMAEDATLISRDPAFRGFPISVIWE